MRRLKHISNYRAAALILAGLSFAYILPFFHSSWPQLGALTNGDDTIVRPLLTSAIFAFASSIINISLALYFAICLRDTPLVSKRGLLLALLLLPVLIGQASTAFLGKMLFSDNSLFQASGAAKMVTLLFIQFWEFGLFFTYLFWLVIKGLRADVTQYFHATGLTDKEQIWDQVLPASRILAIVLFILNFVSSFNEDAKAIIIFKTSRGTQTELISQWLNRQYNSMSLVSTSAAIKNTFGTVIFIAASGLITLLLITVICNWCFENLNRKRSLTRLMLFVPSPLIFLFVIGAVLLPIGYTLFDLAWRLQDIISNLSSPLTLTLLASLISTAGSIAWAVSSRLGWRNQLNSFNRHSAPFFVFLFMLQLIPPLVVVLTGFQWSAYLHQATGGVYLVWFAGHVILSMPILVAFLTTTHFRVRNVEIDYYLAQGLTFREIVSDMFWRRFKADYLLTFLLAFTLIWNEPVINNMLSDFIPSFVSEMRMSITGRSTNYQHSLQYLLVSLGIAGAIIGLWMAILKRNSAQQYEGH